MFGKKKHPADKKKKASLDKLVMGAIVGGAVGSVIGMSIAPKKGSETREILAQQGKNIYEKGKEYGDKIQEQIHDHVRPSEKKMVKPRPGFFSRVRGRFFKSKEKNTKLDLKSGKFKEIPHEQ